ncbi:hypothetical protein D9758_007067 [Tetrapyrgos nigripes]|uniref:RNase H type-1 domain-containing protein n=1 Tax=Tetrapyrgos nigripes TaxID=182062 RepID=A0A8H5LMV9_9AGAR|nr:hypothetical protein D9758_007067 [Tetrapyrgos nigripes]
MDDLAAVVWGKSEIEVQCRLEQLMIKSDGVMRWADKHNCSFGIDKFNLVYASYRKLQIKPPIQLQNTTITSETYAKFLGVLVDSGVQWKEQFAKMVKKGQGWVHQFRRMANVTKGVAAPHICNLYKTKAVERMLYAADIVLTPQRQPRNQSDPISSMGVVKKLTSVQRQAAIIITGALRTTPTELLDIHAGLTPMHLEVQHHRHQAVVRICTLPLTHPLAGLLHQASVQSHDARLTHRTPLHDLLKTYNLRPDRMEKKSVVRYPASWDPGVDVRLWETEVEATDHFLSDDSHIQVYTDGSGYQNGVGASAVLFRNGKEMEAIRYRLGMDMEHEVYEGECIGLILALHLLTAEPDTRSVSIWVDNTAALQAITNPKPGPAHYILDWFHHALETYKRQNPDVPVFLSWIPSHTGILGNERADEEAKRAAAGDSSPNEDLPTVLHKPLPISQTSVIRTFRTELQLRHDEAWAQSHRYQRFKTIDPVEATKAA